MKTGKYYPKIRKKQLDSLSPDERKIYDAVLASFPATHPSSAFNTAIAGGANFNFICK